MGNAWFTFIDRANDPSKVIIPPNLSGFNRAVLSLPEELSLDDVLNNLVVEGYINGVEEHDIAQDQHIVIKQKNEEDTVRLIKHLNDTFGYIAHKGYVKPSRNIVIDHNVHQTADAIKSPHIALVQSPIAKNPNEQFSAFRREFDPESEFPKFERVDIEEIIHYSRAENVGKRKQFSPNHVLSHNLQNEALSNQANNALSAMSKGLQFDVAETEVVKDRDAVKIDYVEKARQLRMELKNISRRRLKNPRLQRRIREQFKYDHMKSLIDLKRKKYGIDRTKRIYAIQRKERLKMAKMKQMIDPHLKPSEYSRQQNTFWQNFDYSTK